MLCRIVEQGVEDTGQAAPQVAVVMGSKSDWATMQAAALVLAEFGVAYEARVVSAHRMPDELFAYAEAAQPRGLRAIIAGAGGAAHLPGMLAAKTVVPVLGVPVASRHLQGLDSLYSIVQMPAGVPVGTLAIGKAGAVNAGLLAAAILALHDDALAERLDAAGRAAYDRYLAEVQAVTSDEVTALLDRITHHCDILETGNDSFRFKHRRKQPKPGG